MPRAASAPKSVRRGRNRKEEKHVKTMKAPQSCSPSEVALPGHPEHMNPLTIAGIG
jgi:hypothetical protein